jgi:protein phosphatase
MPQPETAFITDIGKARKINQDRYVIKTDQSHDSIYALLAVADGVGSLPGSEKAAEFCVTELSGWWEDELAAGHTLPDVSKAKEIFYNTFFYINERVLKKSSGSTLTAIYIKNGDYIVAHVGDSRVYKITGDSAVQLTADHSWTAKMVEAGELTEADALIHPNRGMLINCMGYSGNFFVDTMRGSLSERDTILLCSDGVYRYIKITSMAGYFAYGSLQSALNRMRSDINETSAADNYTAVAFRLAGDRGDEAVTLEVDVG